MTLNPSSVIRSVDPSGENIKSYTDSTGSKVQGVALVNEQEQLIGGPSYPLYTQGFGLNNIDEASSTITYIGKETDNGRWLVMKIDTSVGTAVTYATIVNNPSRGTYAVAWAARAALFYNTYAVAV